MEEEYETISLEIPDELLLAIAILAHERDMKLNDLLIEILLKESEKNRIEELRKEYNRNVEI